ncbi:MAG: Na+/H+ antiporter subunit E [Firmicutes bacterium]|nr:Na+/H+ antiporter subunit E [Bacillota bacterium]
MFVRQVLLNIFLAFVWMLLQNSFNTANFLAGYVIGAIVLYVFRRGFPGGVIYLSRFKAVLELLIVFLWELLKASFTVAAMALSRKIDICPGIVSVPTELQSELAVVLLANLITLTPGTLTVDIAPDRSQLYVHVLNITGSEEEVRREIKDKFEKRILKIVGGRK